MIYNNQTKCPLCGSTKLNEHTDGTLLCSHCKTTFKFNTAQDDLTFISTLSGNKIADNANNIDENSSSLVDVHCENCGATMTINTNDTLTTKCHWCRNNISLNKCTQNNAMADEILPFKTTKENAFKRMQKVLEKRIFYADKEFSRNFKEENVFGVYLPYIIVDVNSKVEFNGFAESTNKNLEADVFKITRIGDLLINDLTVESSYEKVDINILSNTNNIINSIMPFDTENCIEFCANFVNEYNFDKRDLNIDDIKLLVDDKISQIVKNTLNDSLKHYDRGVKFEKKNITIIGKYWKTAYLPVWLYSYKDKNNKIHYTVSNGRTLETMGSIPINKTRLIIVSIFIEITSLIIFFILFNLINISNPLIFFFMLVIFVIAVLSGLLYALFTELKYANYDKKHNYTKETQIVFKNKDFYDEFMFTKDDVLGKKIAHCNNEETSNYSIENK